MFHLCIISLVSTRNIQTPVVKKTDKVSKHTESGISSGQRYFSPFNSKMLHAYYVN